MKTLIDQGSSVDILYWKTFRKMGLSQDVVESFNEQIIGFLGERVDTREYIDLDTMFGEGNECSKKTGLDTCWWMRKHRTTSL